MKIAQASQKIKAKIYINSEGKAVIIFPDGQGIKAGCDQLSKMGIGPMDHSESRDYQNEVKSHELNPEQNVPLDEQDQGLGPQEIGIL